MSTNDHILHFSLGPVQGFVAQARRTRDLWAGSFLLSWLSGQAMAAVLENGGDIEFPFVGTIDDPKDEMLRAILRKHHTHPHIGSIPNRFKAQVPESFDPKVLTDRLLSKWIGLCESVWDAFVSDVTGNGTREIWERQSANFWEIQWIIGKSENEEDKRWLDLRKNWRSHWPTIEGGDHCVLMSDFQELSGYCRANNRTDQDRFWKAIRNQKELGLLDLRPDERLCAIALVKRLFPKLSEEKLNNTIGWVPGEDPKITGNWPSTVYMASVPWLEKISQQEKQSDLEIYVDKVKNNCHKSIFSERATQIDCLQNLSKKSKSLDGNFFQEITLKNHKVTPLSNHSMTNGKDPDKEIRDELLYSLNNLYKKMEEPASPYYALLLMDGDHLGILLGQQDPLSVSMALQKFTQMVPETVEKHSGITIYAGGDDVLAILPINKVLDCAIELRNEYGIAFKQFISEANDATASTAIIFSHFHNPFREVIEKAHHHLDDIAKEKNGRNSLSIALMKSSGISAKWCVAWSYEEKSIPKYLKDLQERIKEGKFSTGFFYNLRQRYSMIIDEEENYKIGQIEPIFIAEYIKGMERRTNGSDLEEAKKNIQLMMSACHRYKVVNGQTKKEAESFQIGGVMLARFLANGGVRE
jgi:CRISPR-associated protein Cmr2